MARQTPSRRVRKPGAILRELANCRYCHLYDPPKHFLRLLRELRAALRKQGKERG